MYIRVIPLLLILSLTAASAEEFSLEQALTLALENNIGYKAAKSTQSMAEADIKSAAARLNPNLISDSGIAEDTYRMGIEQTFELGGKRHKRINLAKAQEQQTISDINQAKLDLSINVRTAYVNLYLAQEQHKAYEDILASTQKLLTIATKKQKAGDSSKLDVLQADITVVNANNDLLSVASSVAIARNQLNNLVNQELAVELTIQQPSVPTMLVDKTIQDKQELLMTLGDYALAEKPELQRNIKSAVVARKQEELEKAKRIPDLSLTVGPDLVTPSGDDSQLNLFFIANMGLPVFDRKQGPIAKAKAEQGYLELRKQAIERTTNFELANALSQFFANQERVRRYETELLPKALEIVEKSRRSFEEGKAAILVPLNAQQAYASTKLGYLEAIAGLQGSIASLEKAVGVSL